MLFKILPSYLLDSRFFEETERTNFGDCHAYKDNITGSILEPQGPFMIKFAQDIVTQKTGDHVSILIFFVLNNVSFKFIIYIMHFCRDRGAHVTLIAKYVSEKIEISFIDFRPEYLCKRYGALFWSYGNENVTPRSYTLGGTDIRKPLLALKKTPGLTT